MIAAVGPKSHAEEIATHHANRWPWRTAGAGVGEANRRLPEGRESGRDFTICITRRVDIDISRPALMPHNVGRRVRDPGAKVPAGTIWCGVPCRCRRISPSAGISGHEHLTELHSGDV